MSFLISDIESLVRLDLTDPLSSPTPRWQTPDLDRAIDKAVMRYSQYYPNVAWIDMNTQPWQRTYPYPTPWNASYPVWWIERIIYPLQTYQSYFSPPGAGMTAAAAVGTSMGIGAYSYAVTFLSQSGETTPSPVATVTTTTGNQQVNLANIPIGPSTPFNPIVVQNNTVIGRNLYRSQAGGTALTLLATIPDNTATTYTDTIADSAIATTPPPPTVNTSGVTNWPPEEIDFAEFSNIWDSTASLAGGGNLSAMGAVGSPGGQIGTLGNTQSFTLKLNGTSLPQDATLVMRIFYATKHQLDVSGTTIPDVHRDIITLGATAYAMEAYQIPTNDNFDFQDGALRDRVDDTKIPAAWLAATAAKMTQFEARLTEVKNQRDFASSARVHYGDIPARYPRL